MEVLSRNPSAKTTAVIFADIVASDTAILDALIAGAHVTADPSECFAYAYAYAESSSSSSSSSSPSSLFA